MTTQGEPSKGLRRYVEVLTGPLEHKKRYRDYKARVERLPASHRTAVEALQRYMIYFGPGTGESLLRDTRVVVVMARGGGYGPGTPREPYDFQTPYLRAYFGNLGVRDIHFVAAELTLAGLLPHLADLAGAAAESLDRARTAVTTLAAG